jgi:hypothetical protein
LRVCTRGNRLDHLHRAGVVGTNSEATNTMDDSIFTSLQILLFSGAAIAFCVWQLHALRHPRGQQVPVKVRKIVARRPRRRPDDH